MKLRMYLRGFGLGIVMTALVMSFGVKTENSTMTDAEVRQRALELGMVDESTTLASPAVEKEETSSQTQAMATEKEESPAALAEDSGKDESKTEEKVDETQAADETVNEDETQVNEETAKEDEAKAPEVETKAEETEEVEETANDDVAKEEETARAEETETGEKPQALKDYTLTIQKGYSSDRVAKILEEAGVIDSAASFDKYLCSNGYDNRISVGTYTIPAGSEYASIAKLITRTK